MKTQKKTALKESLVDRHGAWCAWCVAYSKKDSRIKKYPLVPAKYIQDQLLSRNLNLSEFPLTTTSVLGTVPAHQGCQQSEIAVASLQDVAKEIEFYLKLCPEGALNHDRLENAARELHERGTYGLSALLKKIRRAELAKYGMVEGFLSTLEYEFASLSRLPKVLSHIN
jgi:hypothetical protein